MKNMLDWTLSKILSFLIIILGWSLAYLLRDGNVFIASVASGAGLMGLKTYVQGKQS